MSGSAPMNEHADEWTAQVATEEEVYWCTYVREQPPRSDAALEEYADQLLKLASAGLAAYLAFVKLSFDALTWPMLVPPVLLVIVVAFSLSTAMPHTPRTPIYNVLEVRDLIQRGQRRRLRLLQLASWMFLAATAMAFALIWIEV
jgi:hypothetical protein